MEDFSRYKRKSLIITGLGTFMGTLDASIINVSLPFIIFDCRFFAVDAVRGIVREKRILFFV